MSAKNKKDRTPKTDGTETQTLSDKQKRVTVKLSKSPKWNSKVL